MWSVGCIFGTILMNPVILCLNTNRLFQNSQRHMRVLIWL
jgi:hypothetical protein